MDTYSSVDAQVAELYVRGIFPIALGGDHSVTLPLLRACAKKHGPVSLVQLDSHPDTWDKLFGKEYGHTDFVDPAYAPGAGTPEVGGPSSRQVLDLMRELRSLPLVGFDLVEVAPAYDHAELTSMLAANVVYEAMSALAWRRQRGPAGELASFVAGRRNAGRR